MRACTTRFQTALQKLNLTGRFSVFLCSRNPSRCFGQICPLKLKLHCFTQKNHYRILTIKLPTCRPARATFVERTSKHTCWKRARLEFIWIVRQRVLTQKTTCNTNQNRSKVLLISRGVRWQAAALVFLEPKVSHLHGQVLSDTQSPSKTFQKSTRAAVGFVDILGIGPWLTSLCSQESVILTAWSFNQNHTWLYHLTLMAEPWRAYFPEQPSWKEVARTKSCPCLSTVWKPHFPMNLAAASSATIRCQVTSNLNGTGSTQPNLGPPCFWGLPGGVAGALELNHDGPKMPKTNPEESKRLPSFSVGSHSTFRVSDWLLEVHLTDLLKVKLLMKATAMI